MHKQVCQIGESNTLPHGRVSAIVGCVSAIC